jgi:hypothetical protein
MKAQTGLYEVYDSTRRGFLVFEELRKILNRGIDTLQHRNLRTLIT